MDQIREISPSDAAPFLELCRQLDKETAFMLLEPGERGTTVDEQQRFIEGLEIRDNQTLLLAHDGRELTGFTALMGGAYQRNAHTASLVLGVLLRHQGRGIGKALLARAIDWARAHDIKRLELTVMSHNASALSLYEKTGFEFEGVRRRALRLEGNFIDEYYMALLL